MMKETEMQGRKEYPGGVAEDRTRAAAIPDPPEEESLRSSTILIVDDEPTCIRMARRHLRDAGYTNFIDTTESARVIDLMRDRHPDIVLLDMVMPEVDGLEILRRRASDRALMHIPVLVLTASREDEVKVQALKLGATDFLHKPVDPNDLLPRVHNLLTIKANQDRLARLNASLEDKVREQTEALRRAYDELSSIDRLKQDFLILISHELRTPVTAILGSMELLSGEALEDEAEREQFLGLALQQTLRLQQIIRDVEQFLYLTAGKVDPQRRAVVAAEFLDAIDRKWRSRAQRKGLSFSVEAPEPVRLYTDDGILEDSLDRLIENAMKFTERGGIAVRMRAEGGRAIIEVQDSGRGIEADQNDTLLSFLKVGENIEHHSEGRGLGLAIVRRQMQLLDGEIEFESAGKDRGSTFRLFLPLAE